MSIVRAQIVIPHDSGLPEDSVVNTLHFSGAVTPTSLGALHDAIRTFLQTFDGYLSSGLASPATVKYYNLDDPEPRAPIKVDTINLTLSGSASLPQEVACCLSYQAAPISGAIQSRRRGRVYVGPLGGNAASGGEPSRPESGFLAALRTAAETLVADTDTANIPWVVWSEVNTTAAVVTDGWTDDAWDTQRRRGLAPTLRTAWTA